MGVLTVFAGILCVFGGVVAFAMLAHAIPRGVSRLVDEWDALWHPLTRWLPKGLHISFTTGTLVIGLPALVLAHTLATLIPHWLR